MAVRIAIWLGLFGGLYLGSRYSFILFHSLVELFAVVVACGIFMVAWNSRAFVGNRFLLVLGIGFLMVGCLDLVHTLAYKGMAGLPGMGSNTATQLWVAARTMQVAALLAAPLLARRDLSPMLLLAAFAAATGLILTAVFTGLFPRCWEPAQGLTTFKVASEFVLSALLVVAIMIIRRRQDLDRVVQQALVWSCVLTIISEMSFTLYDDVYGLFNQVGHYLKLIAFYLIYKATIQANLTRPYAVLFRDLKHSEEALRESEGLFRTIMGNAAAAVVFLDPDLRVREFNPGAQRLLGWQRREVLGRPYLELMVPEAARETTRGILDRALSGGDQQGVQSLMLSRGGAERTIIWNAARLKDARGQTLGVIVSGLDITQREQIAAEREKLIAELEHALVEIRTLSGLLPICANCKKIRDDSGYWRQLETYLEAHSEATFSHGICPDCARQLYPELALDGPPWETS